MSPDEDDLLAGCDTCPDIVIGRSAVFPRVRAWSRSLSVRRLKAEVAEGHRVVLLHKIDLEAVERVQRQAFLRDCTAMRSLPFT